MCSSPKVPKTTPPPPTQEQKAPDAQLNDYRKRSQRAVTSGTLLTGNSGVAAGDVSTGKATLLGA